MKFWVGGYGDEYPLNLVRIEQGNLIHEQGVDAQNPSFIAQSGRYLLAVSETFPDNGELWLFDTRTHVLEKRVNALASAPCHITVAGDNAWVSFYGGGNVMRWQLPRLTMQAIHQQRGSGKDVDRQASPHVHSTILTPDKHWLIAADLGTDELLLLTPDKLVVEKRFATQSGDGPRHMAWLGNMHLLVTNELSATLSVYLWLDKQLTLVDRIALGTKGVDFPGEVQVVDGHIYVSVRGNDQIQRLSWQGGKLKRQQEVAASGKFPRHFYVHGQYLLVANQLSDRISLFERNPETGAIGRLLSTLAMPAPAVVMPAIEQ